MGLNAGAGAASQDAGSMGEAREEAEAGLREEVMPTLCTTGRKIPFRMSWRNMVHAAGNAHSIPWSESVEGGPAGALDGGDVGWQHSESEAVAEGGPDFPSHDCSGISEREVIEPGR